MTNEEFIKSISLEGEEWRDVTGWEGLYAVSNIGRVVSYGRIQRISNGRGKAHEIHFPKKIMSLCEHHNHHKKGDNSYFSVMLRNNGKNRRFLVHRIVATEFIPNPLGYKHIDHIDANKHNNREESEIDSYFVNRARYLIAKEFTSDEKIENEMILNFNYNNDYSSIKIHYTLLENIAFLKK